MFTTTGSTGLYKAPFSKSLLIILSALAFLLAVPFSQYKSLFMYNLQKIKQEFQIWRLICGRFICLDLTHAFCSCLLIYNFRIFERRYGSRKFASFLLCSWVFSALFDTLLVEALHYACDVKVDVLPSGLLAPVFALFVPFYCSIPRVQVTRVLGQFAITNKSLVYLMGLQTSGMLYHNNVFKMQHVIFIPDWVARCGSYTLEPLFSTDEPTLESAVGMGATLDIQRQQRMDRLDQQLLLSQLPHMRRNTQQQGGLLNWNRFFPSLRQRWNANHQADPRSAQNTPANPPQEVSEEQVARLMEMGFSRVDALEALRASNNDVNVATNFLLQR
ncbi:ubiquitin-associated domain-containing protein 2-like isoform X2 [Polyodon spathula]|uniref:ubiquitin-associated domain-containing protein 2-like isoform X2 n=1 Tax=Polyodon spathula TaxID=7913 RepID=UPI001B7E2317|nr:ubiquitin-associated domain-containing protein 2-like isoform X2 [Polyodon spathula]